MLLSFIKLSFVIKIFVLSIFKWPFYTGFTVHMQKPLTHRCEIFTGTYKHKYIEGLVIKTLYLGCTVKPV